MNTINKKTKRGISNLSTPVKFGIALALGLYIGVGGIPEFVRGIIYLVFSIYCLMLAAQNNVFKFFSALPYLTFSEIIIRANDTKLPNLFSEYVLIGCFALMMINRGTKLQLYSRSFIFIFLFLLVELFDCFRTKEADFARLAVVNTTLLFLISFWSATNIISIKTLNTFLLNLKLASVFLTGNILAAHLFGHISYTTVSNSESTNSLAPVQVSAYLGLGTILFFLSIVNPLEKKQLFLNIVLFTLSCTIMLLSFSRGGLYFVAAIAALYFLFNRKELGNYFIFLMLLPIGFLIYYYVDSTTNGLIVERYQQAGASGRDKLVMVGLEIFRTDPFGGIGTGNFSKEIVTRHLYEVESGAHNDFIRAAAEHGILGIFTYWMFYIYVFVELMMQKGVVRQYALYFFVLFCLILVHNGLKISLQHTLLVFIICKPALGNKKPKQPGMQPALSPTG